MNRHLARAACRLALRGPLLAALLSMGCLPAPPGATPSPVAFEIHFFAGPVSHSSSGFGPPLQLPLRVLRRFEPPAQRWLPGNRGVDLAATAGEPVFAAAAGTVIYAAELAGRGVLSISHGLVRTTYEPIDPAVAEGDQVVKGQLVGHASSVADHCGPPGGCLHWGALRDNHYVDPMALLGPPKVRLLPIWG
jgi:murein DD-endopeptidase MepM/ murein hydrolase activator NlpD